MLPSAGMIKKTAKQLLEKNHFVGIVACLPFIFTIAIVLLATSVLSMATNDYIAILISFLILLFANTPLFFGTLRFFLRNVEGVCDYPSSVFYYFSSKELYFKTIRFIFSLLFRLVVSGFILSIPATVVGFFSKPYFYDLIGSAIPLWIPILATVSGLLYILAIMIFFIVNLKYYLSMYLFVLNEETSPNDLLKLSQTISRRTQIDFVYLIFSMFAYIVLTILFMPSFVTLPIMFTVYIIHSKFAVLQYNETVDLLNKN